MKILRPTYIALSAFVLIAFAAISSADDIGLPTAASAPASQPDGGEVSTSTSQAANAREVAFKDLPSVVQATFKQELGQTKIETVSEQDGELPTDPRVYVAIATWDGHKYRVEITVNGRLNSLYLYGEEAVPVATTKTTLQQLPPAVKATLDKTLHGAEAKGVFRETVYKMTVKVGENMYNVQIEENGKLDSKVLSELDIHDPIDDEHPAH